MVRLNKNHLTKKQLDSLFAQLGKSLGKLPAKETDSFLTELLGPEERVMLAKRLATIILLIEGKSLYSISRDLKISTATAEKIKSHLNDGGYEFIITSISKNQKVYISLLNTIDSILHLGGILPHYNGLDRYKGLPR